MQKTVLRHRAVCTVCGSKLPPRSEAWYDDATRTAVCLTCHRLGDQAAAPAGVRPDPWASPASPATETAPGSSAAGGGPLSASPPDDGADGGSSDPPAWPDPAFAPERSMEPRPRIRSLAQIPPGLESWPTPGPGTVDPPPRTGFAPGSRTRRLPLVGPSLAAEVQATGRRTREAKVEEPPPPPPVPWALQPTPEGEQTNIGRALDRARAQGIEVLRSRPWGGTTVGSESFVVAPSGVWVVDGLFATTPLPKDLFAGHSGSELINVVGGRTSIISGLLFDSEFLATPVRGALCFEQDAPGWFDEPFFLAGILVTDIRRLIDAFFSPLLLDADTRGRLATHLAVRL